MTLELAPQRDVVPRFRLGQTLATPAALALLEEHAVEGDVLMFKHNCGDWGDALGEEDAASNDQALIDGDRILSAYHVGPDKVWIITEADRSVTTILLPEDY